MFKTEKYREAAYPEDEVEEEKHVFDTFGAAFDSHGGPLGVFKRRLTDFPGVTTTNGPSLDWESLGSESEATPSSSLGPPRRTPVPSTQGGRI